MSFAELPRILHPALSFSVFSIGVKRKTVQSERFLLFPFFFTSVGAEEIPFLRPRGNTCPSQDVAVTTTYHRHCQQPQSPATGCVKTTHHPRRELAKDAVPTSTQNQQHCRHRHRLKDQDASALRTERRCGGSCATRCGAVCLTQARSGPRRGRRRTRRRSSTGGWRWAGASQGCARWCACRRTCRRRRTWCTRASWRTRGRCRRWTCSSARWSWWRSLARRARSTTSRRACRPAAATSTRTARATRTCSRAS